ncbi:MAG: hypothetical protein M1503_11220 [Thaumarchaeota archaeon]|nr:hypothetical protein [Nitrososphaerota archaeon]
MQRDDVTSIGREWVSGRRKTVLRTTRIPVELDKGLELEADKIGVSINTLVNMILTKYIVHDIPSQAMYALTYPRQGFKQFIDAVSDEQIADIGKEEGKRLGVTLILWFGKHPCLQAYLDYYSVMGRYNRLFNFTHKLDGRDLILGFEHELGIKWSIYVKNVTEAGLREIFDMSCESYISDRAVTVKSLVPIHLRD